MLNLPNRRDSAGFLANPPRRAKRAACKPNDPAVRRGRKEAPRLGLEPRTYRLTAGRSTIELSGNQVVMATLPDVPGVWPGQSLAALGRGSRSTDSPSPSTRQASLYSRPLARGRTGLPGEPRGKAPTSLRPLSRAGQAPAVVHASPRRRGDQSTSGSVARRLGFGFGVAPALIEFPRSIPDRA